MLRRQCDIINSENQSLKKSLEEAQNQIFDLKNRVFELETKVKSQTLSNDATFTARVTELFTDFLTPNQVRVVLKKETKTRQDEIRMK